uniref:Uncharacterized protein n=1 Tax=Arundo donax TaxID=35708 RepID=A0A0A9ATW6_ARUDO
MMIFWVLVPSVLGQMYHAAKSIRYSFESDSFPKIELLPFTYLVCVLLTLQQFMVLFPFIICNIHGVYFFELLVSNSRCITFHSSTLWL